MTRDLQRKSVEILQAIESRLRDAQQQVEEADGPRRPVLGFDPDVWGENTWTVWNGDSHTHVGIPGGSFEQLVDNLHDLLCKGRGLTWHDPNAPTRS